MTGPMSTPRVTPLRYYLREQTTRAHGELDAAVGVMDSMDRYARYLAGQFRFRDGMEELLTQARYPGWFGAWRPTPLAAAIRADLAGLGLPMPKSLSAAALAGHVGRGSGLVGTLYVIEGAALGARVLSRSVQALGLPDGVGASHLDLQTSGHSWRGFLDLMGSPDIDREEAAEAAVAVFAHARGAFAKDMHEPV